MWPRPTLMGALLLINKERKTCYHGDGNQNKLVQEHAGHMYLPSPYSSKKQLLKKTRLRSVLRASTAVTITLQKKNTHRQDNKIKILSNETQKQTQPQTNKKGRISLREGESEIQLRPL